MEDFLHLDAYLNEEEKIIRDSVRRLVEQIDPNLIIDATEKGYFPAELIPQIAKLGVLGMTFPEAMGGSNASFMSYGLVCQELEKYDSSLRSFVSVQSSLSMFPIFKFGTDEQKNRFLPKMARGELIGCFGLTEPDVGSDPASMKTHAKKVPGGWRINGSKMWITNGPFADLAIIWAKTEDGIRGFIVEKGFQGYEAIEVTKKLSLRASATGELVLQDCFVPDENFLVGTDEGLTAALQCLNQARYGIAWGVMGAAMSCYQSALHYTLDRKQFGKPLASYQLVQKDLVDMFTEITKGQSINFQIGRLKDQGKATAVMISMAKMNNCREALKIARKARNLLGANGISMDYPVIRHMVNLESVFTYEGTDNIHHLIIGKHITGLDAFS